MPRKKTQGNIALPPSGGTMPPEAAPQAPPVPVEEEKVPDYRDTLLAGTNIRALALQYAEILNTEKLLAENKVKIADEVQLLLTALDIKSARIPDVPEGQKPLQATRVIGAKPCAPGQTENCRKPKLNLVKLMQQTGITSSQIEAASDPYTEPVKDSIRISVLDE